MASKEAHDYVEHGDHSVCDATTFSKIFNVTTNTWTIDEAVDSIAIENNEKIEQAFDAGVTSVPSNAELVDELQALREELKRIKEEHKVQESAELHQLKEKLKWHNPEELPIQQENEVKKLFLIKFTMNHSDEIHVGCGYFSFSLNKFTFPVSFIFQDTCKLISWKEIE